MTMRGVAATRSLAQQKFAHLRIVLGPAFA
jgi:hypothetical protein